MGTILGDLFKNVGKGLDKVFDGDIVDGLGDVLGAPLKAAGRTVNSALNLVGLGEEEVSPAMGFFLMELAVLAKLAKVDGRVDRDEIAFVNAKFDQLELDAEARKPLKAFFNEQKKDVSDCLQCANSAAQYAVTLSPDADGLELRLSFYRDLFLMAAAAGVLHDNEIAMLRAIPEALGLKEEVFEYMAQELFGGDDEENGDAALAEAYATLGVSPDASDSEVKKAWKKKLAAFHPDKIQGKDLDPEWVELANQKSAEINQAYETIKAARRSS